MESKRKQLEDLRSELVGVLHTQPFTIYTDETIEDLLKAHPMSLEELTNVKGFPANGKRVKCFGKAIVAIFRGEVPVKKEPSPQAKMKKMDAFGDSPRQRKSSQKTTLLLTVTTAALLAQFFSGVVRGASFSTEDREAMTTVEMTAFLEESKKESRKDWEEQINTEVAENLQAEEFYQKSLEERVAQYQEQKSKERKDAAAKVKKSVSSAVKKSLTTAKKAEDLAKELKKKAAEKKEKARKVETEILGEYVSYTVYNDKDGDSSVKSWMPHRKGSGSSIFSTTSDQYKLQLSAYTGDHGIRTVDGRYCIAVGSHYATKIGTKIDVVLETGTVLWCILADQKADKDTDSTNSYHTCDGSYVEFVVDTSVLDSAAKRSGNMSSIEGFEGKVVEIRVYEE